MSLGTLPERDDRGRGYLECNQQYLSLHASAEGLAAEISRHLPRETWVMRQDGLLRQAAMCIEPNATGALEGWMCDGGLRSWQLWDLTAKKQLQHRDSGQCLHYGKDKALSMQPCVQAATCWKFGLFSAAAASARDMVAGLEKAFAGMVKVPY